MRCFAWMGVCVGVLLGCSDDSDPVPVGEPTQDVSSLEKPDTDVASVDTEPASTVDASILPEPQMRMMISTLAFPEADEDGRVPGFDLDDSMLDGVESACGQADFEDRSGNQGIDNQVSILTPIFDLVGVGQIHQYLQESIDSSGFFLLFDVNDVDSLTNDPSVSLVFEVGGGSGVMGRDGGLVPNQTMCVQKDSPSTKAEAAWIEDGMLYGQFTELTILVSRFERVYPLTLRGAKYSVHISDLAKGRAAGVVGGGVSLAELMDLVVKMAQNQSNLVETVEPLLVGMGDLPDGDEPCGAMSVGLVFDVVPVFFYPPEVQCDPCGNSVCDSFESCETCRLDCCPGCGNAQCDVYETGKYDVTVGIAGFSPDISNHLVGDKLKFINTTEGTINLVCDDMFSSIQVVAGDSTSHTIQNSGEFTCRTYEQPGNTLVVKAADNHTEDCQSCPEDCGECE